MMTETNSLLEVLETGPSHPFSAWPNAEVPRVAAGVYTVWQGPRFLYVGMAGRGQSIETLQARAGKASNVTGLFSRLGSHASGKRSGDQFCVYVCGRFVLLELSREQIVAIGEGAQSLDVLVRSFIRASLTYRFILTASGREAADLERQAGAVFRTSVPPS